MNNKGFIMPLAIMAGTAVVVALFVYFTLAENRGEKEVENNNTNINNSSEKSDYFTLIPLEYKVETTDWNTYTNSTYSYYIKYPKDYNLTENENGLSLVKTYSDTSIHSIIFTRLDNNSEGNDKLIFNWGKDGFEEQILDHQRIGWTSLGPFILDAYSEKTDAGKIIHYFYYHWCDDEDFESVYHFIDSRTGNLDIDINKNIISTFWILECGINSTT